MIYSQEQADNEFCAFIRKYLLERNPDAALWVLGYYTYVHAIDDFIDGDRTDFQHFLRIQELALICYSNVFYQNHITRLYPLLMAASNAYMDSVAMEHKNESWKKAVADALRQQANELIIAVIETVGGYEMRREASLKLREISWKSHHEPDGKPC
jgi:hypothetical protein